MRLRARGDGGAVIVEAALILPWLFLLVAGSLDFGNFSLQRSQASSAARDGARYAILHYKCADGLGPGCGGSSDETKIESTALARAGTQINPKVDAHCYGPGEANWKTCSDAIPDVDYIEVTVSWTSQKLTGIAGPLLPGKVISSSRMSIVGLPTTAGGGTALPPTPPPPPPPPPSACTVSKVAATSLTLKSNGKQLENDGVVTISTNGDPACLTGTWTLTKTNGTPTVGPYQATPSGETEVVFTLRKNDPWSAGEFEFTTTQDGAVRAIFTLTVS